MGSPSSTGPERAGAGLLTRILACGFVNFDMIAAGLPRLPEPGEVVHAPFGVRFRMGGHTANVSVDLLQLGAPEGSVAIAAAVGDDIAGKFIEDFLISKKVECHLQKVENADTGRSIVLVREGRDRCFILNAGANTHLSYDHVVAALDDVSPGVLYLACGILGQFDARVGDLLKLCRSRGITTVLDAVEPEGREWGFIRAALPYTDVMHSNRQELEGISGTSDPRLGLERLADEGVTLPVLTDGPEGAQWLLSGRLIRQPAFKVRVIDPTGAGDAFSAGAALSLARLKDSGRSLQDLNEDEISETLLSSQAAGAACVEAIGTTPGVTAKRVVELLGQQGEDIRTTSSAV
jgi:sugar/nucleoside kinase (ribokinase family)